MLKKTLLAMTVGLFTTSTFAADIDTNNLDIAFQGAHFQGAGNQITMLRVPVTNTDTGETQFFDMSAEFAVDKNGSLVFKNTNSVKSVAFTSANHLVAGHYLDNRQHSWWVDGPSVGADGRQIWSIQTFNGFLGRSAGGQIMSGPLKSNELAANADGFKQVLKNASALNYGIFNDDDIISAAQSGNMISIVTYSSDGEPARSWSLRAAPEPQPED